MSYMMREFEFIKANLLWLGVVISSFIGFQITCFNEHLQVEGESLSLQHD